MFLTPPISYVHHIYTTKLSDMKRIARKIKLYQKSMLDFQIYYQNLYLLAY